MVSVQIPLHTDCSHLVWIEERQKKGMAVEQSGVSLVEDTAIIHRYKNKW